MNEESLSQLYLKDTAFQNLMQRRIFNVLLVASPYDAFMMVAPLRGRGAARYKKFRPYNNDAGH